MAEGFAAAINELCRGRDLAARWAQRAERAYGLGLEYERKYHGCGQCTLAAVFEAMGTFDEAVFEAVTRIAGGLGHCGEATCGALIAASLAIGLAYPRRRAHFDGDRESRYRSMSMVEQLVERYQQRFGSIKCHDTHRHLFGRAYDLRVEAEREAFDAAGAHDDKCTSVVAQVAKWTVEIIGAACMADASEQRHDRHKQPRAQ